MNVSKILFILFLIIPISEIYLFIKVGGYVGTFSTMLLIILTAIVGVWMLRIQGISTLMRAQEMLSRGEIPAVEVAEGVILLICAVLLITPGFFTDTVGFLLLFPPIRRSLIMHYLGLKQASQQTDPHSSSPKYTTETNTSSPTRIIEGEVIKKHDDA